MLDVKHAFRWSFVLLDIKIRVCLYLTTRPCTRILVYLAFTILSVEVLCLSLYVTYVGKIR